MKVRALFLAILVSLAIPFAIAAPADAGPRAPGLRGALNGSIVVPAEWSGIWSYTDSVYDCSGVFQSLDSGLDTLCTGLSYDPAPDSPYPARLHRIRDLDHRRPALHVQRPDRGHRMHGHLHVRLRRNPLGRHVRDHQHDVDRHRRNGASECSFFPDQCTRTVSRATRIAAEPTAYCATPVEPTTWGRVKSQYR